MHLIAFKRLESLLDLDELPAKDAPLTRTFIYTKLPAALLMGASMEIQA